MRGQLPPTHQPAGGQRPKSGWGRGCQLFPFPPRCLLSSCTSVGSLGGRGLPCLRLVQQLSHGARFRCLPQVQMWREIPAGSEAVPALGAHLKLCGAFPSRQSLLRPPLKGSVPSWVQIFAAAHPHLSRVGAPAALPLRKRDKDRGQAAAAKRCRWGERRK